MAISDADDDGEVTPAEQGALLDLKKVVAVKAASTDDIFTGLRAATDKGTTNGLTYVSAFPALEQDVLAYNLSQPKMPLVAIYPEDGIAEADFPYLVLNADWSKQAAQGRRRRVRPLRPRPRRARPRSRRPASGTPTGCPARP